MTEKAKSEESSGKESIQKTIQKFNHCPECGAKLLLSHWSDYKSLLVQETARCLDCGKGNRKDIHVLN